MLHTVVIRYSLDSLKRHNCLSYVGERNDRLLLPLKEGNNINSINRMAFVCSDTPGPYGKYNCRLANI